MKIIIEGAPKEITALVLELQGRQAMKENATNNEKQMVVEGQLKDGFYID